VQKLRIDQYIIQMRDLMQQIHSRTIRMLINRGETITLHSERINARVMLASYMIVLHPQMVFENMGTLETSLCTSANQMLRTFLEITAHLARGISLQNAPENLTLGFPVMVNTYLNDFRAWKIPDERVLTARIVAALNALYSASGPQHEPGPEQHVIVTQIDRLREKLAEIAGIAAVQAYDRERQNNAPDPSAAYNADYSAVLCQNLNFVMPSKEQLAHEILMNPGFQFQDDGSMPGVTDTTVKELHDEFWCNLIREMQIGQYVKVYLVLSDVKNALVYMLNDVIQHEQTESIKATIVELLDFGETPEVRLRDSDFRVRLVGGVVEAILSVLHRKREEWAKEQWTALRASLQQTDDDESKVIAFADSLRFIFSSVIILRMDAANDKIQRIAPIIVANGAQSERNKFEKLLAAKLISVQHTTRWLKTVLDELKLKQLTQLTRGDTELLRSVHHAALVNLLVDGSAQMPEILRFDTVRLAQHAAEFKRLVTCATLMHVICSFAPAPALFHSISNMVLAHSPEKPDDVEQLYNVIMQTELQSVMPQQSIERMRQEMALCFDADFDGRILV
jgi:hypothetical protein